MNDMYRRVLVVGGGIGGLCAASALSQAGCEVDLVEIKPEWGRSGVGIIQPSNALRALHAIGAARPCMEAGYPYEHYDYLDGQGKLLSRAPGLKAAPEFSAFNGIVRGTLHDILLGLAMRAGVRVRMGTRVTELSQDHAGADVGFSDGVQARYDLVVAADGIYSEMRTRLFGQGCRARTTGQSAWRLTMPRPAELSQGIMMVGPGSKAGFIPISRELMYLLLVTREPDGTRFERDELAGALRHRLEGFGGLVRECLRHVTPDADVIYRPMEVVMLATPWHAGRVVFIGDAAHASTPHLGQGAAMAIEDAVVLAELVSAQVSASALGEAYMQRRYKRASEIQNASLAIGEFEMGRRPDLDLFATLSRARALAAESI